MLISNVLQWTPTHGYTTVGRLAKTYILILCGDFGCNLEDLPRQMARESQNNLCYQYTSMIGLAWFYGISIIVGYLMPNTLYTYILNIYDLVWFGLVWFYGISTIICYSRPNPLYTYILDIYDLVWFGWLLWHINHCRLFNAKSSLYIYIKYVWFGLVWFYGISIIVGYLMPNPLYTYILNIYY